MNLYRHCLCAFA